MRGQNWAALVIRVTLKQDRSGCQGRTRREESSVCTGVMLLCSVVLSLETLWAHYANQTFLSGDFVRYNNIKIKSLCLYFQRRTIETSCISVGVRNHPTYSTKSIFREIIVHKMQRRIEGSKRRVATGQVSFISLLQNCRVEGIITAVSRYPWAWPPACRMQSLAAAFQSSHPMFSIQELGVGGVE